MLVGTLGSAVVLGWITLAADGVAPRAAYTTWSHYGGSADSAQYSALAQIDRTNVRGLVLAWSYTAPRQSTPGRGLLSSLAFSPLVVDGTMYVLGQQNAIVALDAATGARRWSRPLEGRPPMRGLSYWASADGHDRRLLFSADNFLHALDAGTGEPIASFGTGGRVDLREGVPRARAARGIQSSTPGRVFENLLLMGSSPSEDRDAPPGDIRAFDVVTGKLVWTFHTIPRAGEYGYDTWPEEAWTRIGGANAWAEIAVDEARAIAYFPLGSPTYDFYGADRKGANLFGNCLVALDARTGKRLWHFQTVHHDLWDYDLATGPKLLTVEHEGKRVDAVAQATKLGFLYVLNRETGEPLWPIEERPVPASDVPGESAWPTQPFPSKPPPFSRQAFTASDLNPHLDEGDRARLERFVQGLRNEGLFTPPSVRGSMQMPGQFGAANWGAASVDPLAGLLYLRSVDLPTSNTLREITPRPSTPTRTSGTPDGRQMYRRMCAACHGMVETRLRTVAALGHDRFAAAVRSGRSNMPPFPQLTDGEITSIFNHLVNAPEVAPAPAAAPYVEGQTRYVGQFANLILADNSLPAIKPPWSELVAYDLNEGTIRWRVPFGNVPILSAKGTTGTGSFRAHRNCPVTTAGGLIFLASGGDATVRAHDTRTGDVLWEHVLPANPDGIPAVYEVGGRQFVAFFAGTERDYAETVWKPGDPSAQGYYVFALPAATAD
jgi:quinoprotein glucose dehydrogenase